MNYRHEPKIERDERRVPGPIDDMSEHVLSSDRIHKHLPADRATVVERLIETAVQATDPNTNVRFEMRRPDVPEAPRRLMKESFPAS